jgi:hypothetical protein
MSAWFLHKQPAEIVGVLRRPRALLGHRPSARRRKSVDDKPKRLAADVSINGSDDGHVNSQFTMGNLQFVRILN